MRNSRATCCSRHSVMLPTETFVMRKRLLTLFLVNTRQKAEETLKTYDIFIYEDIHYISDFFFVQMV